MLCLFRHKSQINQPFFSSSDVIRFGRPHADQIHVKHLPSEVTKCFDHDRIPLVGLLAADVKNDFARNAHLLAKSSRITVSSIFNPTAHNIYGHLIVQRPEIIGLKLSVDQQPVSATKQTMIQKIISSLKWVTRRLNQEGNTLKASSLFRSESNQRSSLPNVMNDIGIVIGPSRRMHGLHFVQAHAQRCQSLACNAFRKKPLDGPPLTA